MNRQTSKKYKEQVVVPQNKHEHLGQKFSRFRRPKPIITHRTHIVPTNARDAQRSPVVSVLFPKTIGNEPEIFFDCHIATIPHCHIPPLWTEM